MRDTNCLYENQQGQGNRQRQRQERWVQEERWQEQPNCQNMVPLQVTECQHEEKMGKVFGKRFLLL